MPFYSSRLQKIRYINNTPYLIIAAFPIENIKDARGIKTELKCDTAFKVDREGIYIFCNEIKEPEWEDTTEDKPK